MPKRYSCPVELTVDVVGGRWRTVLAPVLQALDDWGVARAERTGAEVVTPGRG